MTQNLSSHFEKYTFPQNGKFRLTEIPYRFSDLEPTISKQTVELHWGEHHRGYVEKLNAHLKRDPTLRNIPLEKIIRNSAGDLFNQAAQHWNHSFYWHCMGEQGSDSEPSADLKREIDNSFIGFDEFQTQFITAGTSHFGSGWVWLVELPSGSLKIITTQNADSPIRLDLNPLLVCDIWEHSYYLDYQNRKKDYLDQFFELINWEFVNERYKINPYAIQTA